MPARTGAIYRAGVTYIPPLHAGVASIPNPLKYTATPLALPPSVPRSLGHDSRELFVSVHMDENPVGAIDGHARVLTWETYQRWLDADGSEDGDDKLDETTYTCRAQYYPGTGEFVPLTGASSLSESARRGGLVSLTDAQRHDGEGGNGGDSGEGGEGGEYAHGQLCQIMFRGSVAPWYGSTSVFPSAWPRQFPR